jgi:phosphatidylserine decarboxylase
MPAEPIRFYNRYTRKIEVEQVYGERWMRLAYENPGGRFLVWLLFRRAFFSKWYGWRMSSGVKRDDEPAPVQLFKMIMGAGNSAQLILPFIRKYNVDVDEFAKSPFDFKTFNEFFYRALKPGARPISPGERIAVFPADGRHLAFQDIQEAAGFYVKGAKFSFAELFGDEKVAEKFAHGAMLISRLCPVDYHRFHFPVSGTPAESWPIKGWLYSVSPLALRRRLRYLIENKREVTLIETSQFGTVAMLEVGATNVGTIRQSYVPGRAVQKGDEKGFFAFGGSCVITVFQRGRIRFDADVLEHSAQQIETYAKMGDRLGEGR